jgi:endonuclease/exonuclease/phosphatase family metal-dependent hydrolase
MNCPVTLKAAMGVALLTVSAIEPVQAEDRVRIATVNCEFLITSRIHVKYGFPLVLEEPADIAAWQVPGFREQKMKEGVDAVARLLARVDADVLALCEVGPEADVELLRSRMTELGADYPFRAVCDSADTFTEQHVAVLSRRELADVLRALPGREMYDRELDDENVEDDTGVSKGMRVTFSAGGRPVHLFVAHLSSERGGHEQDAQRIAQASILRRNTLDLLNRGEHVIVAGDLNDHRGQPAIRRIRGRDDIFDDLFQTGEPRFFDPNRLDTRWTYVFQGERQQIDHVLVSRSLVDTAGNGGIVAETMDVVETLAGSSTPATDHRPFVVNVRLP